MLAEAGHYVVRFDNRDIGLSEKLDHLGTPDVHRMMADTAAGKPVRAPYTLADMAADTVGLMPALGIDRAHICGVSMGGMIAQVAAIEYPQRVRSLISMESSTGESDLPGPTAEAMQARLSVPPLARGGYMDHMAAVYRAFSGGSPFYDPALQRDLAARAYDRSFYLLGFPRQLAAVSAGAGRRLALKAATVPALVLHGDSDALVPLEHGSDTARAMPDGRLEVVPGLGHGLAYPKLWEQMVAAISEHTSANR
jgi:pimeloyl-ACP methyl ester carboxylesterase